MMIFSILDLKSGYHKIHMNATDIPMTVFIAHEGLYEFKEKSFGLSYMLVTFQSLMNLTCSSLIFASLRLFSLITYWCMVRA